MESEVLFLLWFGCTSKIKKRTELHVSETLRKKSS